MHESSPYFLLMIVKFFITKKRKGHQHLTDEAMYQLAEQLDGQIIHLKNKPHGYVKFAHYEFAKERIEVIAELPEGSPISEKILENMF